MARRHAGDFSHLGPILLEDIRPSSPISDSDIPSIPSTSTGLWGDDAVTISTEMMGSPTASPIVGCPPLPVPSHHVCEREPITEAQQIAAQYRQRWLSSQDAPKSTTVSEQTTLSVSTNPLEPSHRSPPSTVMQSGVSTETQSMNAPLRASSMPPNPPSIRRSLAEETQTVLTPRGSAGLLSRVREDGTVLCDREDCLAVLPSLKAFLSHLDIHLIHEGYVTHLGWWIGALNIFRSTD